MMNIHHLELFYYVARHGGIMPAVRNIPYGIQQPAVSGQVAQLEEYLGATLFHRRPFALTAEGEKLYAFIHPFFSSLDKMASQLQGGQARHIRIGASTIVLRDHMPVLLQSLRKRFPGLKVSLRDGYSAQLEQMLAQDEIDLAITLVEKKVAAGLRSQVLLELPLVLLALRNSPITSAEQLWKLDRITEPLICLPSSEAITRNFLAQLSRLRVEWYPSVEASSADLVESYVECGLGIGLMVAIPGKPVPPKLRVLALDGFKPVPLGLMWRGRRTALLDACCKTIEQMARELKS